MRVLFVDFYEVLSNKTQGLYFL